MPAPTLSPLPRVLCLSGLDPTGGAGLQADIEAVAACGGHALGLVTALTVQDTHNVHRVDSVPAELLAAQLDTLLDDCPVQAVKIGLLGSAAQIGVIAARVRALRVPLVIDPVLRAGGGMELTNSALIDALWRELLPLCTVLTPNAVEAHRLGGAEALLAAGCANVLVTGGDAATDAVHNDWHRRGQPPRRWSWPRIALRFHGAGCTLASALAARLAAGGTLEDALDHAQAYTHRSLQAARPVGEGRWIAHRLHALDGTAPSKITPS